ncbi:hypothetical protein BMS3Abin05_02575 [bacterium BMS3Abin05]|nr:hypothetical protein BMS3Abin05_02575 [bacterium BMS3Abin05]
MLIFCGSAALNFYNYSAAKERPVPLKRKKDDHRNNYIFFRLVFLVGVSLDDYKTFKKEQNKNKKGQKILGIILDHDTVEFNNRIFHSKSSGMEYIKLFDSPVWIKYFYDRNCDPVDFNHSIK